MLRLVLQGVACSNEDGSGNENYVVSNEGGVGNEDDFACSNVRPP